MNTRIPVIILTGFLGSGKTTLLNRLLSDGVKTAVIINEFGSTPVDQELIEQQNIPLTILAGGCVCCQIKGTLAPTLRNLWMAWDQAETKLFDRMIIETSGVASPEPILDTLLRDRWLSSHYKLQQVITTVAFPSAIDQMDSFPEVRAQVAWADVLLLTHSDLANTEMHNALDSRLQTFAPATPRFIASREHCNMDALLTAGTSKNFRELPVGGSQLEHGFRNISLHLDQPMPWSQLQTILENILINHPKDLLRIKGVVYLSEHVEPVVIQAATNRLYPPSLLPNRVNDDHRGRLVFIFTGEHELIADELIAGFGATIGKNAVRIH